MNTCSNLRGGGMNFLIERKWIDLLYIMLMDIANKWLLLNCPFPLSCPPPPHLGLLTKRNLNQACHVYLHLLDESSSLECSFSAYSFSVVLVLPFLLPQPAASSLCNTDFSSYLALLLLNGMVSNLKKLVAVWTA